MHFFTEPGKLQDQIESDAFGPLIGDPSNKYRVSSKHKLNSFETSAKIFACQDSLMIVQPHTEAGGTVSASLVNIILKPIVGLNISFTPVQYYVYRGVDMTSFIDSGNVTNVAPQTDFISKFWTDWTNYLTDTGLTLSDPSPKSFGYDPSLSNPTESVKLIEEYFNSAQSMNTVINDFQAIRVKEGTWIANISSSNELEFEIITDTDHLTLDLAYFQKSVQIVDVTGKDMFFVGPNTPDLDALAEREKILNYIDPTAFFGMHYNQGVNVDSPAVNKVGDFLYVDVLSKFKNQDVIYLDIRSERGYSYYFYQNYRIEMGAGTPIGSTVLEFKSESHQDFEELDYRAMDWPIINLKSPTPALMPLLDGDKIQLKLHVLDNTSPILFAENPKLFGDDNTNNFKSTDQLVTNFTTNTTDVISLTVPTTTANLNVAHHVSIQYFRNKKLGVSLFPLRMYQVDNILDAAFGGVNIEELAFARYTQHIRNTKKNFISTFDFSFVGETGVYDDNNTVLFYCENTFSLRKSGNNYPEIDVNNNGIDSVMDNPLLRRNTISRKWRINDGTEDIDIIELLTYNKSIGKATPQEDIYFLGLTKTEYAAANGMAGVSDLHSKYFKFTEEFPNYTPPEVPDQFKDTITQTPYRKFKVSIQGLDQYGDTVTVDVLLPPSNDKLYVYGTSLNMICSAAFGALANSTESIPDPVGFIEYQDFHIHQYNKGDVLADLLFPAGKIQKLKDYNTTNKIVPRTVPFKGDLFYPVDTPDSQTLSTRMDQYPLILISHGNGQLYTDYRELGSFLAKNGFIVASVSNLFINKYTRKFLVIALPTYPSDVHYAIPPTTVFFPNNEYFLCLMNGEFYVYFESIVGNSSTNGNYANKKLTRLKISINSVGHLIISNEALLSWEKGVHFQIFAQPEGFTWDKVDTDLATGDSFKTLGLTWKTNSGSNALITKNGAKKIVELTGTDWGHNSQNDIKNAIDAATSLTTYSIALSGTPIKYMGVLNDETYYMLKITASSSTPCGSGTCYQINGEIKNRALEILVDTGDQDMRIFGRSNVVYPHLQYVKKYIQENFGVPGDPNREDRIENNIGLIGHSRGAEAVVRCAREIDGISTFDMSTIDTSTDGRTEPVWKYVPTNLNTVNAVASIAPTDQGTQIQKLNKNIPYLVLYGSMDGDVVGKPDDSSPNRTSGYSIYDRTNYHAADLANDTEKSMSVMRGATHNGFITNNSDFDYIDLYKAFSAEIVTELSKQRNMVKGYLNAFFRYHLKSETIWKPIIDGTRIPDSINYKDIFTQYKNLNHGASILDFEVTSPTNIGTGAGQVSLKSGIGNLSEGAALTLTEFAPHDTGALKVAWQDKDELTFHIDPILKDATPYDYLSFRIGHIPEYVSPPGALELNIPFDSAMVNGSDYDNEETIKYAKKKLAAVSNAFKTSVDLSGLKVRILDTANGKYTYITTDKINGIQVRENVGHAYSRDFGANAASKLDDVLKVTYKSLTKASMQTIRVPLNFFDSNGVDLAKIAEVVIEFPLGNGKVLIDDVEFTT